MKLKTKLLVLAFAGFFLPRLSQAQLKIPGLGNPDVRNALEQVIGDFPLHFSTLKGEIINTNPQTVEYESLLTFKSAEKNIIVQHSGTQPVFSWQAVMFTAEEFADAEKKYKTLFNQLKGMNLKLNRDYDYSLAGDYDKPDESLFLVVADDNILFFADKNFHLYNGNEDFSYTLNRVAK